MFNDVVDKIIMLCCNMVVLITVAEFFYESIFSQCESHQSAMPK